jgi:hypothetical protein
MPDLSVRSVSELVAAEAYLLRQSNLFVIAGGSRASGATSRGNQETVYSCYF